MPCQGKDVGGTWPLEASAEAIPLTSCDLRWACFSVATSVGFKRRRRPGFSSAQKTMANPGTALGLAAAVSPLHPPPARADNLPPTPRTERAPLVHLVPNRFR